MIEKCERDREEKIRTVSDRALTHCLRDSLQHNTTSNHTRKKTNEKQQHTDSARQRQRRNGNDDGPRAKTVRTNEHISF